MYVVKYLYIVAYDVIVRLFLGISQSFVPQIAFTKPEIYILFSIFWTVRKSRLSQTSGVDNCSRWAQSLDLLRMRNCISHAGFSRFLTRDERHWSIRWTKIAVVSHAWWNKSVLVWKIQGGIKMLGNIRIWCVLKWAHLLPYQRHRITASPVCNWSVVLYRAPAFFQIWYTLKMLVMYLSLTEWSIQSYLGLLFSWLCRITLTKICNFQCKSLTGMRLCLLSSLVSIAQLTW